MESLLQQVTSSKLMSMLDGFSRCNQVLMEEKDKYKIMFTTPWGTYSFNEMLFGLTNVGSTLQREMDHAFKDLIGKFIDDYQDELIVHSKLRSLNLKHLREVFSDVECLGCP